MIRGYTRLSLHDVTASSLVVSAEAYASVEARWACIKIENYDLTMFAETRSEAVAILTKLRDTINTAIGDDNAMRDALQEIADSHLPDQPAAAAGTDYDWACKHIGHLRRIAVIALGKELVA